MEQIIIKKNSFWHIFIHSVYSKLPKDTCALRRRLILTSPFFIIGFPVLLYAGIYLCFSKDKYYFRRTGDDSMPPWLMILIIEMIGLITMYAIFEKFHLSTNIVLCYMLSPFAVALICGLLAGIVVGVGYPIMYCREKIEEYKERKREEMIANNIDTTKPSVISTLYKSAKDKYCKKIKYE